MNPNASTQGEVVIWGCEIDDERHNNDNFDIGRFEEEVLSTGFSGDFCGTKFEREL
jgi:hypothetical protein